MNYSFELLFPNKWLYILGKKKKKARPHCWAENDFSQSGFNLHYKIWSFFFFFLHLGLCTKQQFPEQQKKRGTSALSNQDCMTVASWDIRPHLDKVRVEDSLTACLACLFDLMYLRSYWILAKQNTDLFSPEYAFHKQPFVMTSRSVIVIYLFSLCLKVK